MASLTVDAYLTGLAKLVNVAGVTALLNGAVYKGARRPEGGLYPCVTVSGVPVDVGNETTMQTFDGTITVYAASLKNGLADLPTLSAIEAQVIPLVKLNAWTNGNTACLQQNFRGTFGPFWDAQDESVHYLSIAVRSYMVDLT